MPGVAEKKLLILSDGKQGHVSQSIALAHHLGRPFETAGVRFRSRPFKLLSYLLDRIGAYLPSLLRWDPPEGPFCAVVSAGSETYYANKVLARRLGVPSVAIMLPRGYRLDFDRIIAQEHDRPPRKENILVLPVNLSKVEPKGVFRPRAGERYVALVVGGPNPVFGFDREPFREALDAVFACFPGFRFVVTTSRRTPAGIEEEIDRYPFEEKFLYSRNPVNPIPDFLASCEYVFLTADSTSMISEAVTFGSARIEIIPLPTRKDPGKYGRMIGKLAELGCVHRFDGRPGTADRKIDLGKMLGGIKLWAPSTGPSEISMKVCLVLASTGEGGLEAHVANLANALSREIQVVVIAPRPFGSRLGEGVAFEPVDLMRNRRNPAALWQLFRALRKHRPDIVHAQASKAATMVAAIRRLVPAPCVATVHGLKRDTRVYRKFNRVVAVSNAVADTMPAGPVTVIYNGVDLDPGISPVDRRDLVPSGGAPFRGDVVVAVGRLAPVKGFDLLLRAWRGIDADLLIVGDGPERGRLRKLAETLGVANRVHFLGFREDAVAIVAACDLMVISSHREGFSLVGAEALQVGVPVVATAISGIREFLPEDALFPPGDVDALGRKIGEILGWPRSKRLEHFAPCFRRAREELTMDHMTRNTLKLYRELAGG